MRLEKLFWSKSKVSILIYLLFKREGISLRALEKDLNWTFPAIKKQIDALLEGEIITIDKSGIKRSIFLANPYKKHIKNIFLFSIASDIQGFCKTYNDKIYNLYYGKTFWALLPMDLVIIHNIENTNSVNYLKEWIATIFRAYYIDNVALTTMTQKERDQRYRLADKFVLSIMKDNIVLDK